MHENYTVTPMIKLFVFAVAFAVPAWRPYVARIFLPLRHPRTLIRDRLWMSLNIVPNVGN